MPDRLLIFIKNPVQGKVKTRLAATIGEERALQVYLRLLGITRSAALGCDCERDLWYSDSVDSADEWDAREFRKHVQQGSDLGARMSKAFTQAFGEGADAVCIIGSDCAGMEPAILREAFSALHAGTEAVIGPARDGGYYLLGLRAPMPELFTGITWSTDTVRSETVRRLQSAERSMHMLPELSDIDTEADLREWENQGRGM